MVVVVVVALVVRGGFLRPMRGLRDLGGGLVGTRFAAVDDPSAYGQLSLSLSLISYCFITNEEDVETYTL